MKYLRITIIALITGGLAFGAFQKLNHNKKTIDQNAKMEEVVINEIPVTVTKVSSQEIEDELKLIGNFEARKELSIIAESQGIITDLSVSEGQKIMRGQIIASIDDATIQSQLSTAKASLAKMEKDVERYNNLLKVGAISQIQFEEIELNKKNQETNITAIEQQLKYTKVRSPMSGIVSELMLEQGSFASPGTPIATVVDISKLNMIVMVDEQDVVKVKQGQSVRIQTEVYPDVLFKGTIIKIGVQADAARKYEIAIELINNTQHPLKAGMYGTAIIPAANNTIKEVITIPRKSVVGSLKQPQVYLRIDGQARLTNIEVGATLQDRVIVLSGLKVGDEVITTGQINLDDGRAVTVVQ